MKRIKQIITIILILVSFQGHAAYQSVPFKTDGCTMFIDGLKVIDKSWHPCCVEHDFRYWVGGEKLKQDHSDLKLKECLEVLATPLIAILMYQSVRLGHSSPIKHPTQWGWGKVNLKQKNLMLEELLKVQDQLFSKEELIEEYQLME